MSGSYLLNAPAYPPMPIGQLYAIRATFVGDSVGRSELISSIWRAISVPPDLEVYAIRPTYRPGMIGRPVTCWAFPRTRARRPNSPNLPLSMRRCRRSSGPQFTDTRPSLLIRPHIQVVEICRVPRIGRWMRHRPPIHQLAPHIASSAELLFLLGYVRFPQTGREKRLNIAIDIFGRT